PHSRPCAGSSSTARSAPRRPRRWAYSCRGRDGRSVADFRLAGEAGARGRLDARGGLREPDDEPVEIRAPQDEAVGILERPHAGRAGRVPDGGDLAEEVARTQGG